MCDIDEQGTSYNYAKSKQLSKKNLIFQKTVQMNLFLRADFKTR